MENPVNRNMRFRCFAVDILLNNDLTASTAFFPFLTCAVDFDVSFNFTAAVDILLIYDLTASASNFTEKEQPAGCS